MFNDNAEFTLGYVCNRPVKPGDAAANTVRLQQLRKHGPVMYRFFLCCKK